MNIRIGSTLGVPVGQDEILIGSVSAIRLCGVHLTSVSLSHKALEYVEVRVGQSWYLLGDCGWVDDELNLVSLEHCDAFSKLG